jgi:energy-coupling factor transporter ATP-binding protein EcfA2
LGEFVIVVSDVEMWAGPRLLLSGATLQVGAGDRVGLVGRNGAGKTTLLKVMVGEVLPAGGSVQRKGTVGYLPQDPRTGDLDVPARDRILAARGLDTAMARMRKAEVDMIGATEDQTDRAMRRYSAAEAEFAAAGGWSAESEAARIAAEAGRQVALSLSDTFCVERHRAAFRSLIQGGVDVLFGNEEEVCALYEADTLEDALAQLRGECTLAAVTRSADGSIIMTPEDTITIPAAHVDAVVDTTGAGDLYAAGFLHGLARGRPLAECGQLASIAAAEIISHIGARPETSLAELAKRHGLAA